MISYLGWTMVQLLTYKWIKCGKNKILGLCIETVQEFIEISNYITYSSYLIFIWFIDNE